MLFGATPFSNSPFADPGGVTVFVALTGNRVNVSTGTVGISASARILPGGSEIEISIGNAVVKIGQTVGVTGVRINLATGTANVISWNPIVPGATGTWVPIDPNNP
jgi:hypothetical protein|tara:strand:- start:98 stop:415 length:318 start_codon:yes stop_codon:yes gene_type:complete